jgi:hypothetical protein
MALRLCLKSVLAIWHPFDGGKVTVEIDQLHLANQTSQMTHVPQSADVQYQKANVGKWPNPVL